MTTRIKGPDGGAIEGAGRSRAIGRPQVGVRPSVPVENPPENSDSVHITGAAHQMLALQQQISETPEVNAARVQELRSAISQKRYTIDASRIADRMLQIESDLQTTGKPNDRSQ